jgi:hypothetical protein
MSERISKRMTSKKYASINSFTFDRILGEAKAVEEREEAQ